MDLGRSLNFSSEIIPHKTFKTLQRTLNSGIFIKLEKRGNCCFDLEQALGEESQLRKCLESELSIREDQLRSLIKEIEELEESKFALADLKTRFDELVEERVAEHLSGIKIEENARLRMALGALDQMEMQLRERDAQIARLAEQLASVEKKHAQDVERIVFEKELSLQIVEKEIELVKRQWEKKLSQVESEHSGISSALLCSLQELTHKNFEMAQLIKKREEENRAMACLVKALEQRVLEYELEEESLNTRRTIEQGMQKECRDQSDLKREQSFENNQNLHLSTDITISLHAELEEEKLGFCPEDKALSFADERDLVCQEEKIFLLDDPLESSRCLRKKSGPAPPKLNLWSGGGIFGVSKRFLEKNGLSAYSTAGATGANQAQDSEPKSACSLNSSQIPDESCSEIEKDEFGSQPQESGLHNCSSSKKHKSSSKKTAKSKHRIKQPQESVSRLTPLTMLGMHALNYLAKSCV